MNTYLCSYALPDDTQWSYFKCEADDADHALEQLLDAEPRCTNPFCEVYAQGDVA